MMTYKQAIRLVESFERTRQGWISILVENPDSRDAPQMIMTINAKIDLLKTLTPIPNEEEEEWHDARRR